MAAGGPLLAALGLFLHFTSGLAPGWLNGLALLWLLGVAAAVAFDLHAMPRQEDVEVQRELPSVCGLERHFVRELRVAFSVPAALQAHFPGQAQLELHEAAPAALEALLPWSEEDPDDPDWRPLAAGPERLAEGVRLALDPELEPRDAGSTGRASVSWQEPGDGGAVRLVAHFSQGYRARRRGVLRLGAIVLHLRGPLGLATRSLFFDGKQSLRVEPAMAGMKRTLELVASQRWWDLGVTRVRHARGGQTEFESLRDYVPGDERRQIDWKAFARRGKPMVRQFEPERGQEVIVLIDCGRCMGASVVEPGLPEWTKLDHALDAGLEFAAAVLSQGDRVGLLAYDSSLVAFVGPARSGRQLLRLKQAVFDLEASERESDLAAALDELSARHRRRALVLVLSDLADPLGVEAQAHALAHAGRNRVVFCAFSDPDLVALATAAPEPGRELEARAARRLADQRAEGLGEIARRARTLDLEATRTAGPLLNAWFQERRLL